MGEEIIYSATAWRNNSELIADVARLGYIEGTVLDVTYGLGNFWNVYRPEHLTGCDLDPAKSPIGYSVDFRKLPFGNGEFDTVVFDPPYRLNGTPDRGTFDANYGVSSRYHWTDRLRDIEEGIRECSRVAGSRFLLKCQDQISPACRKNWQTFNFSYLAVVECGLVLDDRFDMLTKPRPQRPSKQVWSHSNYSTLLVFKKPRKKSRKRLDTAAPVAVGVKKTPTKEINRWAGP